MSLNPQQQQAVDYVDGHLLVLAGAGSGKTRVITTKIGKLILEHGFNPQNIFALTFTNKAAREMQQRIGHVIGSRQSRGLNISTFHTLGLKIIRQECELMGYKPNFSIFDSNDSARVLRELLLENNEGYHADEDTLKWQLSSLKNDYILPDAALELAKSKSELAIAKLYARYQRQLSAYNGFDFDDLIIEPLKLLHSHNEAQIRWQGRIAHLLVDEYQDTNSSQYQLIKILLGTRGKLTAVGDDDQSIYAWRGADAANIGKLQQDYPSLKVIKLEQNYRSMARILKCANQLISNNPHEINKLLWSDKGLGEKIKIIPCKNEFAEAERVVSEIIRLRVMQQVADNEIAILYRGNFQARPFAECLRSHGIAYQLSGGLDFFQLGEIKDHMAYLRLIVNSADDAAFLRIINTPRRAIGAASLEKLASYAKARQISLLQASGELGLQAHLKPRAVKILAQFADNMHALSQYSDSATPSEVFIKLAEFIDYSGWLLDTLKNQEQIKRKLDNIQELHNFIERMSAREAQNDHPDFNLRELIAKMTLMDILDKNAQTEEGAAVNLLTLHAAKGLEFKYVFLVGLEEDLLPHHNSILQDTIEEERRLCYVGITRAERVLTITYANSRRRAGDPNPTEPSRFLRELPEDELDWEGKTEIDSEQARAKAEDYFAMMQKILGD